MQGEGEGDILFFFDQIEVKFYYFRHDARRRRRGRGKKPGGGVM